MKRQFFLPIFFVALAAGASVTVTGPDGRLAVTVDTLAGGVSAYSVVYDGTTVIKPSPLGFKMADGEDYSLGMTLAAHSRDSVSRSFAQDRIKQSRVDWRANTLHTTFSGPDGREMTVEWEVADNDIAFRYHIPPHNERRGVVIASEATGYRFEGDSTTIFATPQSDAMIGWKRTKPSYEEYYVVDAPMVERSQFGHGFTWPALFRTATPGGDVWTLLSETGVDGYYCASHLGDCVDGTFGVAYPMPDENNGNGSAAPGISLPAATPWRTITVGSSLAPVVETVVPWSVVEPRYATERPARQGKGTWSWLLWQDGSINPDDQKRFIDFAAEMGYDNVLIDNWWDTRIGREGVERLIEYARSKGVNVILWYSSSGHWNDIVQGPTNLMDRPIVRKKEMRWLRDHGVRNIKVDFFGGDKQETMRLYEDILSDAADHGIDVIFHGCTLPRGWERMYPNFVGSEAVLASENLIFSQDFCDKESLQATLYPFTRNAVATMEYGGTLLNRRMNRGNDGGNIRRTGDAFQLATAVLYQNPVQNFGLAPNNLADAPAEAIEFMKSVPTTWDETLFIDGYPGRYIVMARRSGEDWYITGVNATREPIELRIPLAPMRLTGGEAKVYSDRRTKKGIELRTERRKTDRRGHLPVTIIPDGGVVAIVR